MTYVTKAELADARKAIRREIEAAKLTGPQGPQGPPGPQGPAGPQGPPGEAVPSPLIPEIEPALPAAPSQTTDGEFAVADGIHWQTGEMERGVTREWRRLKLIDNLETNLIAMPWPVVPLVGPPVVGEDLTLENAHGEVPGEKDGTAEANLWVGCTGTFRRILCRNGGWMGVWTGAGCTGSLLEDLTIVDQPRTGIYIEHVTQDTTFRNLRIEAQGTGINVEWWYEGRGSHDCTIEDFEITVPSGQVAICLDAGTYGFRLRNGVIHGDAVIELPKNLAGPTPNTVENVVRPDGTPVPVVYHDRPIG